MSTLRSRARLASAFVALLALGAGFTSCYGSFALTKKVYQFNGSLGNKWIKSLFVFVLGAPVYGVSGLADAVIFNLVEFWTGSNPVAFKDGGDFDHRTAEGARVQGHLLADGRLEVTLTPAQGEAKVVILDRKPDGIQATTVDGGFVAKVATIADGRTILVTPRVD